MKIDNYEQVVELMAKMKECLPIPAKPAKPFLQMMRERGMPEDSNQELLIDSIFYTGDDGGIICALKPLSEDDKQVYAVSVTHLRIDPQHPLAEEIIAYQLLRVKRLKAENKKGFKSLLAEARSKEGGSRSKGFGK